jgi:hypothetical protein
VLNSHDNCNEEELDVKTHANGTWVYFNSFVSHACVMTTCREIYWLKVSTFLSRAVFSTDAIDQTRIIKFILSSIVIQARKKL